MILMASTIILILGQPAALDIVGEMSFLCWANFDNVSAEAYGRYLIGHCSSGGTTYPYAIGIGRNSVGAGKLFVLWADAVMAESNTVLEVGVWYLLGMVREGTSGELDGYVLS